jgi:hypothetical protein
MMRPSGVVSKNAMGARMMLARSPVCRKRDALMQPTVMHNASPTVPRAET